MVSRRWCSVRRLGDGLSDAALALAGGAIHHPGHRELEPEQHPAMKIITRENSPRPQSRGTRAAKTRWGPGMLGLHGGLLAHLTVIARRSSKASSKAVRLSSWGLPRSDNMR